ncbi:DUF1440 domain-containing protein [Sphingomonas sp. BK235]|jgi:hypothetical protein|uniref:DUF1440 domain-containing protein n=1 Tax=Sphingomonas sp. BK235 TaxID=2512131 RepID=UPI0010485728|nr:DUF1440 domain-containing protein [Sphingomonas sp. BK235]TCP34248.1 hypothetical protein EV292_104239 [Sphingomonas sp. BK235]
MRSLLSTVALGLGAGLAAAFVMDRFQALAAPPLGLDKGNDDPATVKAADSVSRAVEGRPVTQKNRRRAGSAVHYGVGAALGLGYVAAAERWPETATGFGLPFGALTMLLLDDLLVPAAGWGPWPEAEAKGNLYTLGSHLVFAGTVEGVRRGAGALLDRD